MAISAVIKNQKLSVGDTIRVYQKIFEDDKTRIQAFEGLLISIKGNQGQRMFTVRKISSANVGVERIWPADSPLLTKIVKVKSGKVRRAKLYYLRQRTGKKALKIKEINKSGKSTRNNKQSAQKRKGK